MNTPRHTTTERPALTRGQWFDLALWAAPATVTTLVIMWQWLLCPLITFR